MDLFELSVLQVRPDYCPRSVKILTILQVGSQYLHAPRFEGFRIYDSSFLIFQTQINPFFIIAVKFFTVSEIRFSAHFHRIIKSLHFNNSIF